MKTVGFCLTPCKGFQPLTRFLQRCILRRVSSISDFSRINIRQAVNLESRPFETGEGKTYEELDCGIGMPAPAFRL